MRITVFAVLILTGILLSPVEPVFGQTQDQTENTNGTAKNINQEIKLHSPKKASLYSAVLPGLGQAYNKKYWKIPVVYAGFAGCAYLITTNNVEYKKFIAAYEWLDGGSVGDPPNDYALRYGSSEQLINGQTTYRRALEQSVILTVLWYGLNIIDASVDAHFYYFDINEDLSLSIHPEIITTTTKNNFTGIALSFKF